MAEEEPFEEVSDAEKLQIAQHFLLSSPPGQFQEVLADVKKIVPGPLLNDPMVAGIRRAYSITTPQLIPVDGSGDLMLICKQGEVDATHYVDARAGVIRTVDHLSGKASANGSRLPGSPLSAKRSQLQEAITEYQNDYYVADAGAAVFASRDKLEVVLVGSKLNLRNYWAGSWTSSWTIKNDRISGNVKVHGHYFEDGNVQLQVAKDFPASPVASGRDFVKSVIAAIGTAEQALQQGLEDAYQTMSDTTLQAIRRAMPITRTKMVWNVNAHRMTIQLTGTAGNIGK